MAVTVGEVQAVLTARDEMSAALQKASAAIDDMQQKMGQASEKTDTFSGSMDDLIDRVERSAIEFVSLTAVIQTVKEGLDFASNLEETSRATGIATDELQKLDYVGNTFGVTGDMLARTIETLSARLAKGDKNASDAVAFLGLNIDDLLASGPEAAFLAISEAANNLTDPMDRNGVLAELLGMRMGRLVASMGDVKGEMDKLGDKVLISPEAIDSAHQAEVALKNLWQSTLSVTALGATWWTDLIGLTKSQKDSNEATAQAAEINKLYQLAISKNTGSLKDFLAQQKQEQEDAKLAAEEQKKYAKAWEDLANVGDDYKDTLEGIDQETKDSVHYYLDAGAAIGSIAAAFHLTASEAKAFQAEAKQAKQDEKDWEAAQRDLTAAWVAAGAAEDALFKQRTTQQADALKVQAQQEEAALKARYDKGRISEEQYQNDLFQLRRNYAAKNEQLNADSLRRQLSDLQDKEDKEKQQLEDKYNNGLVDDETYQEELSALDQEYADKRTAINEKADADQAKTRKQIWDEYYAWLAQKEDQVAQQEIAKTQSTLNTINNLIDSMQYDLSTESGVQQYRQANPGNTVNWSDQQIIDYIKSGHTLADVIKAGGITMYGNFPGAQGMQGLNEGGIVDAGSGAPFMLHGREAVIPLGSSTGSAAGVGNVTNHFYVNGTAQDVARQISDIIMKQLKGIRQFGAA